VRCGHGLLLVRVKSDRCRGKPLAQGEADVDQPHQDRDLDPWANDPGQDLSGGHPERGGCQLGVVARRGERQRRGPLVAQPQPAPRAFPPPHIVAK